MTSDSVFRDYLDTYREAVASTRYAEVSELQPPPFGTLANGGTGTAYTLWRLGDARRAKRWCDAIAADCRRAAYQGEGIELPSSSFFYGRTGLHWVRALTARGRGEAALAFIRTARRMDLVEYASGKAGALVGASILLAQAEDPRVRRFAGELARTLESEIGKRVRNPWDAIDATGFAHFWPGILYALLAWVPVSRASAPPWLGEAMRGLLAVWSPDRVRAPTLRASWCNGLAGTCLLWAKAFEVLGDEAFLAAAGVAATEAAASPASGVDLCCGLGGVAYALLTLAQIDRSSHWLERSRELAGTAIGHAQFKWPNGLYRGHPGLACLADDLLAAHPRGFPALAA